jgi:phi13 family phage major tail protein
MPNKVIYGLSKLFYSVITEDVDGTLSFSTPVSIPGAVAIKLSQEGEQVEEYADNTTWKTFTTNNGYKGSLEVEILPDSFRKDCLGETVDADSGVVTENSLSIGKPFALLGQFEGDSKGRRWVYYYVTASRPNAEAKTKGKSIDVMHESIDIIIKPRPDNSVVKRFTNDSVTDAIYNGWFTAVYEPTT